MRDPRELSEIERLGEDWEEEELDEPVLEPETEKSGWGGVPLLQGVLCALAVLALLFFRMTDQERYQQISQWYRQEMSQEIQLPKLEASSRQPEPTPDPSPSPTPPPVESGLAQTL